MAVAKGEKVSEFEEDSAYLSDESDFYGDAATKDHFMERANEFDAASWWEDNVPSLTKMANTNMTTMEEVKTTKLYNTYEGLFCGRQLTETVQDFLQRLPPATSEESDLLPWIYIANPYLPRKSWGDVDEADLKAEGPPEAEEDRAQLITLGGGLLQELEDMQLTIQKEMEGKATSSISGVVNKHRDVIVKKIQQIAVNTHCTSGKWLLFVDAEDVNAVWSVVAEATVSNELGIAAKVTPYNVNKTRMQRVICIYTKDFRDTDDLGKIVRKMKDLGLVQVSKPIYYKCDAYTHLKLARDNSYGIKPSMYSSNDFLQPKNQKVDAHFKSNFGDILE